MNNNDLYNMALTNTEDGDIFDGLAFTLIREGLTFGGADNDEVALADVLRRSIILPGHPGAVSLLIVGWLNTYREDFERTEDFLDAEARGSVSL
jgi:hypothetical protein